MEDTKNEMVQFILDIDWMSTKEFCQKYGVPEPYFTGEVKSSADQFLRIDAIKCRMFIQKAKDISRRKKCDDCGTEFISNGRCPECLPMG